MCSDILTYPNKAEMKIKKSSVVFAFLLVSLVVQLSSLAGVVVSQNVSPGATSWPGSPLIQSVTNPAVQTVVAESFNANGATNYCETFTVTTTNYMLQAISIYAGGGTGTGMGTNVTLHLFDLGSQTAPNPSPYIPGTDLFNSGSGLAVAYSSQTMGVLQFGFTGSDQVTLTNGHLYAFEIDGVTNTSPLSWQRTTNDTYTGGAAYRNQTWINGNNARDFALAVYATNTTPVTPPTQTSGQCSVNWNDVHQRIDGFGGGAVFLTDVSDPVSAAFMNTAFGTNANQLALTLLRVRIDPGGSGNWGAALADAQKAVAHGAGVLATPWTPPAAMKDNGALTNGSLLPSQYANYASYLKSFAGYLAANGAPLRAISIQNEPDWPATYESCLWSGAQFESFFLTNTGTFGSTPVMMPESLAYNFSYSEPTLNDPVAVTNVSLVGGHLYGVTTIQDYTNAHSKGKPTWMTEFLLNDQTIGSAVTTAQQIHDCLTTGNMSAYIWWKAFGSANGLVDASGVPQIRGFVMSQWSRFMRPNYYRIGVVNNTNTSISAYKDTNSPNFAIVAVNTNATLSVIQTFGLTNFNAATVTPWITSGSQSMAVQTPVTLTNGSFTYTLSAMSVVTFVGQSAGSTNTAPVLVPVSNQTINVGMTLVLTNVATDSDVPAQILTFNLMAGPTNATLNVTTGVFLWRPLVSQAGTANPVSVQVADNGSPSLSATNNFTITVNPLAAPPLSLQAISAGQVSLLVNGTQGPDYTLLTTTNLAAGWQALFTTNSPAMPLKLVDTNSTDATRFYRVQLGP
jgi:glucuronoarabinoxylan endo-1,4-beta-xylanase